MEFIKVKDIFKIKKGKKVDAIEQIGPIRYIQIDDLRNNNNIKYCNKEEKYIYCKEKDIVIAWDGANAGTVGYGLKGAIGSTLAVLSTENEAFDTEFCGLFLKSKFKYLRDKCTGATIPHISRSSLEELAILNLNITKQKKIVKTIKLAQKLIDKRKEQIEALDELVKSKFIEIFGDLKKNSKEWSVKSFEEVFEIKSSSRVLKSEWKMEGDVPFYRVRDMVCLAEGRICNNEFFISTELYEELKEKKGVPQAGDIMISATSTIGKCYIVRENEKFYYKDADVLSFRKKIEIVPEYFVHFMKSKFAVNQMERTFGVTTVPHFTIINAKKINLLYPDIKLQRQFADFVKQVDKLKFKMEQSLKGLEDNFECLMQKAFKGELFEEK